MMFNFLIRNKNLNTILISYYSIETNKKIVNELKSNLFKTKIKKNINIKKH